MTTPTGSPVDGPIDGRSRQLLWRLRARLVTPPSEQRVGEDLDRVFDAARMHAHHGPSAGAGARPGALPVDASTTHPVGGSANVTVLPLHREDEGARRGLFSTLTRSAAAAAVVLAVGSGLLSASDGMVRIEALLGGAVTTEGEAAGDILTGDLVPPADAPGERDTVGDSAGDSDPGPDIEGPGVPDVEVDGTTGGDADPDGVGDEGVDADAPAAPSGSNDSGSSSGSSRADGSSGTAGSSSGSGGSQQGSDGGGSPGEQEPAPDPTEEIIAAPAPEDLQGFGGPRPCDEDDVTACLPTRDGADADDGEDVGDGDDGAGDQEGDDALTAEELASRRFQG